jgi:hypothetical protein
MADSGASTLVLDITGMHCSGCGGVVEKALGRIPGVDLVIFGVLLILVVRFPPREIPGLIRGWRKAR